MITDWLIKLAASLAGFVLSFLPSFGVSSAASGMASAWSVVRPWASTANYFAPLDVALPLVVSLFLLRGLLIVWYAANWLYAKVPILGH